MLLMFSNDTIDVSSIDIVCVMFLVFTCLRLIVFNGFFVSDFERWGKRDDIRLDIKQSSPIRHAVELLVIKKRFNKKPEAFTFAFTDGGPDHNISFLNVMISWLA